MKKLIILAAGVVMLSSCGTTGSGAFAGASFGGMIGSAIGGIIGGPRGSDVGTLIGMGTGAAAGAAIGSAAEKQVEDNRSARSEVVYQDPADNYANVVTICNARFVNNSGSVHIAKGETAKISFEIHNSTSEVLYNLVPMVRETTGNRRLSVSPAILLETLGAGRAVRYTAFITAEDNLKKGTAHFNICVETDGRPVSNTVELDVPLN